MNPYEEQIKDYFTDIFEESGVCPLGVGWNSEESQTIRFEQLAKLFPANEKFSVVDYGCGYGALLAWLQARYENFEYVGVELSEKMLNFCLENYSEGKFLSRLPENFQADFVVASGIFNKKFNEDERLWTDYIINTINEFHRVSKKGFGFNMLTSYSQAHKMSPELFYANPTFYFDFCKKMYSRQVALLHDYPLYDFTILVRK